MEVSVEIIDEVAPVEMLRHYNGTKTWHLVVRDQGKETTLENACNLSIEDWLNFIESDDAFRHLFQGTHRGNRVDILGGKMKFCTYILGEGSTSIEFELERIKKPLVAAIQYAACHGCFFRRKQSLKRKGIN